MNNISSHDKAARFNNFGVMQVKKNNLVEAVSSFQKALTLYPKYEKSLYNLGSLELKLGHYKAAMKYFRRLHLLKLVDTSILGGIGSKLAQIGMYRDAQSYLQKAIGLNSKDSESYYYLAGTFLMQGKSAKAEKYYKRALKINPNYIDAMTNLGSLYLTNLFYSLAIKQFEKALKINPQNSYVISLLLHASQAIADFKIIDKWTPVLNQLTVQTLATGGDMTETPFTNLAREENPLKNLKVAAYWSKGLISSIAKIKPFKFTPRNRNKKIRVGYISSHFRRHPTAHLIFDLFRLHNRDLFTIYTYSYGQDDKSFLRKDIEKNSDFFRNIRRKNDLEAAKLIHKDKIDILVDLMGYVGDSRLAIMAYHPSPIQVSWLVFPGTTGADFIDYIIADKIVLPEKDLPFYTEKPLYLPCYQMYSNMPKVPKNKIKRANFGLPEKSFVFASFNQTYKIEERLFSIWMEILKEVPESILWQLKTNDYMEKNLKKEAQKRDVDPDRIIFAPKLPKTQHLERLALADLALDSFTYNGHTTTSDCLWVGVPVVTLKGNHFASRVSASLLSTIGLPELITYSKEDYKKLAIKLASRPEELEKLKEKLAKKRLKSRLFDTKKFTKNLEKLYEKIMKRFLSLT